MIPAVYASLNPALRAGYSVYAPTTIGYLLRRRNGRAEFEYAEVHFQKGGPIRMATDAEDLPGRIKEFISTVSDVRDAIDDVDVPGWVVSKPTIAELNADIAIMVIRSKGDSIPFILPVNSEASIAVISGSVRVISASMPGGSIRLQHNFCVLPPGIDRQLMPLEPDTRVYCTFFRARVSDDGSEPSVSPD